MENDNTINEEENISEINKKILEIFLKFENYKGSLWYQNWEDVQKNLGYYMEGKGEYDNS